ncbi:methylmalonyl-CoA mutase family protein [Halpernia frigidisoli]|uniref:Methylmalonyl-CoA mutase n=1 Tax=Halpernia frigidisoli TaxID=1125876 RepID=A0A1I3DZS2_9FLAO|nr:methylmalonyl-CoA mutase family protein [Halpernia frigidisoli]SFH92088.1 methylmalonyl-CoA mutase [Halpernia frigidisoli]
MFPKTSLSDWGDLVKKQLKSEDIYGILNVENLENLTVKAYNSEVLKTLKNLPKIAESTHLVSKYDESLEEDVFAFLLTENVDNLQDKTLFIADKDLAEHIKIEDENTYFSLIDVFDENFGEINEQLAKELSAKNFQRNICIDVSFHQNCGASINQQLAIALSKTKDLIEIFGSDILNKLIFKLAVGSNYFFEISKIRAFKLVFNQLSKEYGKDEIPYIFAETSLRNKSKNDPENNLIRSTLELSAAMIGGADAVFSNNYLLANPTELSTEISFKQQIVLAYESIINVFDDAANGSFFVEDLTQQIAEKSWQLFLEFEEKGGYSEMMKSAELQELIYNQAIQEQNWVKEGKIKLIGVNLYPKLNQTEEISDLYNEAVLKPVRWAEMFE